MFSLCILSFDILMKDLGLGMFLWSFDCIQYTWWVMKVMATLHIMICSELTIAWEHRLIVSILSDCPDHQTFYEIIVHTYHTFEKNIVCVRNSSKDVCLFFWNIVYLSTDSLNIESYLSWVDTSTWSLLLLEQCWKIFHHAPIYLISSGFQIFKTQRSPVDARENIFQIRVSSSG